MVAAELVNGIEYLGQAIGDLFQGKFNAMLVNLLNAGTVVGIFLIIMFLMKFVLEISIFRNQEHKKYATWMAVGIALIGIMNDHLFTFIYKIFAGSLPLILLILLVVFAIIIFINRLRKEHYSASSEMHQAHTEALSARKDLSKEDHDLRLQEKMENREFGAIQNAEHIVDEELAQVRNLHEMIEKLRALLGQLAQVTNQAQAQQLRATLLRGAQALPNLVAQDYTDEEKLDKSLQKLQTDLYAELRTDGNENLEIHHLHEHLAQQLSDESHLNIEASKEKVMSNEGEAKLQQFLLQIQQLDQQRKKLASELDTIDRNELGQTKQLQNAVAQLINTLNEGNVNQALTELATLEQLIGTESAESRKLRELFAQEQGIAQQKKQLDATMEQYVHQLVGVEKHERKEVDEDEYKEKHNFRIVEERVRNLKDIEESGDTISANHSAAIARLQDVLDVIKKDPDEGYRQEITVYLRKNDVASKVRWP